MAGLRMALPLALVATLALGAVAESEPKGVDPLMLSIDPKKPPEIVLTLRELLEEMRAGRTLKSVTSEDIRSKLKRYEELRDKFGELKVVEKRNEEALAVAHAKNIRKSDRTMAEMQEHKEKSHGRVDKAHIKKLLKEHAGVHREVGDEYEEKRMMFEESQQTTRRSATNLVKHIRKLERFMSKIEAETGEGEGEL